MTTPTPDSEGKLFRVAVRDRMTRTGEEYPAAAVATRRTSHSDGRPLTLVEMADRQGSPPLRPSSPRELAEFARLIATGAS